MIKSMHDSPRLLLDLALEKDTDLALKALSPADTAETFVTAMLLIGVCHTLLEKHWLLTHGLIEEQPAFISFLRTAVGRELAPLAFLEPFWEDPSPQSMQKLSLKSEQLIKQVIQRVAHYELAAYRLFATEAVRKMSELTSFEENLLLEKNTADARLEKRLESLSSSSQWRETRPTPEEGLLPTSLDRAFDAMDEIFQLRYELDHGMKTELASRERLYEGAGVGVQTSYATIITALKHLNLPVGTHLIDLGSGYGRVGLAAGLWRDDLCFTGYEYVPHRVEVSRASAERAGISDRVRFITQDLSAPDFVVPEADAYYMYDPFCKETYLQILERLHTISRDRPVTVVTKSGANKWFLKFIETNDGWCAPEIYDGGTLLFFRSKLAPIAADV